MATAMKFEVPHFDRKRAISLYGGLHAALEEENPAKIKDNE